MCVATIRAGHPPFLDRIGQLARPSSLHPFRWFVSIATALVVLSFCWASRVQAQFLNSSNNSTPTAQTPAPQQTFKVSGTVADGVTGEPIGKALVQLNGQQHRSTFTDSGGRFEFEGVPAGTVAVWPQKPGYFGEQELTRSGFRPVEVGPDVPLAVVKLFPEAVISGKVISTAGVPLESVSVSLIYLDIREGRRRWDNRGSAITDSDGRFRFAGLRPGSYYLSTSPYTPIPGTMIEAEELPTTGYSGAYYSGAPNVTSATSIELRPGQQAEANFSLNEVPVFQVAGIIGGYAPDRGVALQIVDSSGVPVSADLQFSPENGRFDVRTLPAGEYVLRASSQVDANQTLRAEMRLNVSSNLYNLRLVLAPSPTIPVVVTMDSVSSSLQQPFRHGAGLSPNGPPISVRLLGSTPGTGEVYAAFDHPEGPKNLVLRNVDPGRYMAVLDARESWYVASAQYGDTNLLTDDLVLTPGSPALPLTITLRNDAATLTGSVNIPDGMTTPVTIVAIPDGPTKATPRIGSYFPPRDRNSGNPEFVIDFFAPGAYSVFAFDHTDGLEYANPDVIEKYVSQASHVVLAPNQRAKIALELIRTEDESK